jgi:hypothetical protein
MLSQGLTRRFVWKQTCIGSVMQYLKYVQLLGSIKVNKREISVQNSFMYLHSLYSHPAETELYLGR